MAANDNFNLKIVDAVLHNVAAWDYDAAPTTALAPSGALAYNAGSLYVHGGGGTWAKLGDNAEVDRIESAMGSVIDTDGNYVAHSGTSYIDGNSNVTTDLTDLDSAIAARASDISDMQGVVGVDDGDEDLGTFTGAIIADNASVKVALQALETEAENFRGDLQTAIGIADEAQHLGTFTGAIISDNGTVKAALQALETEEENFRGDLQTAMGISDEERDLGSFSGGIISDDGTVKAGMQELETEVENVRGDLQSVLGVSDEATGFSWSGTNYLTSMAHSNASASFVALDSRAKTNADSISANASDISDMQGVVGVADGAEDLGTFTGAIIADNASVKVALQSLETEAENFRGDLQTAVGISDEAQHLGTFTGALISDNGTVKAGMQELETELENFRGDLQTAVGIADEAQHLGTFTGDVISDNGTVKAGMQELETDMDALQTAVGVAAEAEHLGTFTGAIIADNQTVKAAIQALETESENFRGDLQSVLGVADEATGFSYSGTSYLTSMAHSNASASFVALDGQAKTNADNISANDSDITDIRSAVGIADGAEDLGTFTGAIIADESSVKVALQALETEAENFRGDLQTAVGISDEAQHLGTFTGATVSDNGTVKAGMQELEAALEVVQSEINGLRTSLQASDGSFGSQAADGSYTWTATSALGANLRPLNGAMIQVWVADGSANYDYQLVPVRVSSAGALTITFDSNSATFRCNIVSAAQVTESE